MKKIWGSILFGFAKIADWIFGGLAWIFHWIYETFEQAKRACLSVILVGCMGITVMPLLFIFVPPWVVVFGLLLVIIPYVSRILYEQMVYVQYVTTEYLYDHADYYRLGRGSKQKLSYYSERYRREQERKRREAQERFYRQQEERRRQQQEEWDRRFRDFFNQAGFGGYEGYRQAGGSHYQQSGYVNPAGEFNRKFREACDTLGVPYGASSAEVKRAYRNLAKKYHPDINKQPGATQKFQEISAAYEFLSEENIRRYREINS